ncbi:MAG TPA: radical SAM protein, partial [Dongiaceae bacterium]
EPRAATPERRLAAMATLAAAGAPVSVMFAPVIPGLNDHELEAVLERAAQAGAVSAGYVVLRLPREIKDLFREWLETAIPDRAKRVMSLVRQMRGGLDYDPRWEQRMKGDGPLAEMLGRRFAIARRRFGLDRPTSPLNVARFRPPGGASDQPDLFEAESTL